MSSGPFGHEHMADCAHILIWEHQAFNRLPLHVRSLDVGGFQSDGSIISLGKVQETCLLTEYVEGQTYSFDLERIRHNGVLTDPDLARADALCDYLLAIHADPVDDSGLYTRRVRELLGHGECIMGLTDSYPDHPFISADLLQEIEHRCVRWRWRIKSLTHRLRQIHGDFHPWNILFRSGVDLPTLSDAVRKRIFAFIFRDPRSFPGSVSRSGGTAFRRDLRGDRCSGTLRERPSPFCSQALVRFLFILPAVCKRIIPITRPKPYWQPLKRCHCNSLVMREYRYAYTRFIFHKGHGNL